MFYFKAKPMTHFQDGYFAKWCIYMILNRLLNIDGHQTALYCQITSG